MVKVAVTDVSDYDEIVPTILWLIYSNVAIILVPLRVVPVNTNIISPAVTL